MDHVLLSNQLSWSYKAQCACLNCVRLDFPSAFSSTILSSCFGYTRYGKYPDMRSKAAQSSTTHSGLGHSESFTQLVQIADLTKLYSVCGVDLEEPSNEEDD